MKRKIEKCWRTYIRHWTITLPDRGKNPFRDDCLRMNRCRFEQHVGKVLKSHVSIEWQEDGGVIVAGVITFSLT